MVALRGVLVRHYSNRAATVFYSALYLSHITDTPVWFPVPGLLPAHAVHSMGADIDGAEVDALKAVQPVAFSDVFDALV